jgi:hypothetical protein
MSRPLLPRKTSADIKSITPMAWNQLVDCVAYGMDHPRGDGNHILHDGMSGMLKLNTRNTGGVSTAKETSTVVDKQPNFDAVPYYARYNKTDGKLTVNGGWANLNGRCVEVSGTTLAICKGYICVCSEGLVSKPVIMFATPSASHYPIAYCEQRRESWVIIRYPTSMPIFLSTGRCPRVDTEVRS